MKSFFILLIVFAALFCGANVKAGVLDNEASILNAFKAQYNNSQSDIIFLMDVSGSVSNYGFQSEKMFVESLLNEFSVAPYSTRVAVITFGAIVQTNINYIDIERTSLTHQKCEFKPLFDYNVVHRYGWATNMLDAFATSSGLLQTAATNNHRRSGVHTACILITDGYWNRGDPRPNANILKNTYGCDVITVGVDGYSLWQLQALASDPSLVIGVSTFTQFRQLALYIRGDAHDRTFMEVPDNKCTSSNGCDNNAFCGCGTVSGIYQCVCNTGYYGTGLPGHCYPCIRGTYKLWPTPDHCIGCPEHSTTDAVGSTLINECKCFTGYEGDPSSNIACIAVECEQLVAPDNGAFRAACGKVYDSVCEFQCNSGYNLVGSSSRRCQSDKSWSGTAVQCQIITCADLPTQAHGVKTCTGNGNEYGNTCSFTCDVGYDRKGSSTRTCQADGQWSGSATTCEARKCPALRQLAFGTVEPVDCVTTPQPYQRGCIMKCVVGYVMNGESPLTCGADGTWQGVYPTCEDNQPPLITCPADVSNGTDPERATRTVTWSLPVVSDNSELHDPNAAPTVVSDRSDIVSPYDFPIAATRITYTATDRSGNSQSCVFTVTVVDNEAPTIYCPQNREIKTDTSKVTVYWQPPTYRDNSGQPVTIFTESINGSEFLTGSHPIKYDVTDHVGNKASCTFIIVVSSLKCKSYDPPINGLVSQTESQGNVYVYPQCSSSKEFARIPASFYICLSSGTWYAWDIDVTVSREMPWPDCTEEYVPGAARKGMQWQYFSGDCTNASVQALAKDNFIKGFNEVFGGGDPNYCQAQQICELDNIIIICGQTQARKRRAAQIDYQITIKLDVVVNTKNDDFGAAERALEGNVTKAKASPSMKTIQVSSSQSMTLQSVNETATVGLCVDGAVFGLNKDVGHKQKCQNCPSGTYFDVKTANCADCALNTYNGGTGKVGQCIVCPQNTYTIGFKSKNITQCLAACQPGEISPTGLANCEACPINTYQSLERGKECNQCPGSSVTLAEGTKSIDGCGMPCAPGTYSQTGVEPCMPCSQGMYQPSKKQSSCLLCPGSKSTYGKGAWAESQCVAIMDCASNPCNNDGACVETAVGYECTCKPGYTGTNCQTEEDECVSSPCAKGATCVDKVNGFSCLCPPDYGGVNCDIKQNSCDSSKCASGSTCVNSPDGQTCECPDGYEGLFCESQINDCKVSPCQNGGTCLNELQAFSCSCPTGFSGNLCEKNDNGCNPASCLNGATCTDSSYGHQCTCAAGFEGSKCETDIKECNSAPCQNNGDCVDQTNGYKCYCKPSFKGTNCETETSTDFDMEFSRKLGVGTSIVGMRQELTAFTVAFWMKVAQTQIDPGTPISYAVQDGAKLEDNAFTIHDYNGFNIWVNGVKASTNVAANDGGWHHMALTWLSSSGAWKVYKDGSMVRQNDVNTDAFQKGQVIASGGSFVLGQEQDAVAANFSANEAFIGKMSQMNVWNYELTAQDIEDMARHANSLIGNVVAWSDFDEPADDGITKITPSVARTENKCWTNWLNNDSPTSGDGDAETRAGACTGPGLFDCQDLEGRSMPDLELNKTTCSDSGITCLNSDQRTGRSCPDFKVRFVCTCPANSACNSNPCGAHGTCETLPVGYKCNCNAAYEGRHCETALKCPCAGTIAHGRYTGSRALGGQITISCDAGYTPSGTETLNCVDGKWDALVPRCIDVDECTTGAASCGHTCVNTMGSYKCICNTGYSVNGDGSCSDIDECASNNGNCQQSCHNSVGSYRCTCSSGYALMADARSCADNNECSSNNGLGPCEQICVNDLLGHTCLCNPGYNLNVDGETCAARSCPALSSFSNGILDPASPATTVDSKVRFECNVGFILKGPSSRTCLADDSWSGISPRCDVVHCILPGDLQDGTKSTAANSYNTVVSYTCNAGFRLVGSATRTCQADGTWSGEHPRCIAADCPEPSVPDHGTLIGLQRKDGDTIRYECDVGYTLGGQGYAICQGGAWNSPTPSCDLVNCGAPPTIANGQIHGSDFSYNAKVTFSCNAANFKLQGSQERTCQADGTWSGTQTYCLENSCGDPGTPSNGVKVGESYLYDDVVQFQCNEGYTLIGSSSRTCINDNNWDGTQPTCQIIDCGDPGTPANGERVGSEFTFGKTIVYDCNPEYQIAGSRSRTCQLDGTWTGSVATCDASDCGATLVGPSGSFSSPNNPNSYPDNAYCRWKISVPVGKKVMVTFNNFKTQKNTDVVEIYDGVNKKLITTLSGVYSKALSFTSEGQAIDIRFVSDGSVNSEGFSASYKEVTCGGVVTALEQIVMSPNYPSDYPNSIKCVWSLNLGIPFQLEFESFHTESGYDIMQGYSSLSSFTQSDLIFDIDGQRFAMAPIQATGGQMYLVFTSNSVRAAPGFKATVKKYQVIVGK